MHTEIGLGIPTCSAKIHIYGFLAGIFHLNEFDLIVCQPHFQVVQKIGLPITIVNSGLIRP